MRKGIVESHYVSFNIFLKYKSKKWMNTVLNYRPSTHWKLFSFFLKVSFLRRFRNKVGSAPNFFQPTASQRTTQFKRLPWSNFIKENYRTPSQVTTWQLGHHPVAPTYPNWIHYLFPINIEIRAFFHRSAGKKDVHLWIFILMNIFMNALWARRLSVLPLLFRSIHKRMYIM